MRSFACVVVTLAACSKPARDPVAECLRGNDRLGDGAGSAREVIAACTLAVGRTDDVEVHASLARARLIGRDFAGVLAQAEAATGPAAPRLWQLAGEASVAQGDAAAARGWYERSLAAVRVDEPARAANIASRLADLARIDERLDAAIAHLHDAIELARRSGDPGQRILGAFGMSDLLVAIGDDRGARAVLAEVEALVDLPAMRVFQPDYLLAVATVEARGGRAATARAGFDRCVTTAPATTDPLVVFRCELGLAAGLIAPGSDELERAGALLDRARARLAEIERTYGPDPEPAAELDVLGARLALRRGRADEALALLRAVHAGTSGPALRSRAGDELARLLRARDADDEAERVLLASTAAVELLRDGAHYRELHRAMPEELRAPYEQLFVLRRARGDLDGAVAAMERAIERDFVDQLTAGAARGDAAPDLRAAARRARARQTLDRRAARSAPGPRGFPPGETVAFFAAEGVLWRIQTGPRGVRIEAVAPVVELADDLELAREDPAGDGARRVRARLFPPSAMPRPGTALLIVPDRVLEGLRFAALPAADGFLIERHPLAIAPSLRVATAGDATPAGGPSVVLGNPDGTLPDSAAEAEEVAGLLGVEALLGGRADRAALATARRAAVLHVASHGSSQDGRTVLHLATERIDGADIIDLELAPRLTLLASCTSASQRREAMWTSVAAGLLAAGGRGVIGALGSIPDADARTLVLHFYRSGGATAPVSALARTQRWAIERGTPVAVWSNLAYLGAPESAGVR